MSGAEETRDGAGPPVSDDTPGPPVSDDTPPGEEAIRAMVWTKERVCDGARPLTYGVLGGHCFVVVVPSVVILVGTA